MNWDDLKYFLAVARYGNLTEAAADLQVSPSTVARRVTDLETRLDTPLFTKRYNGYALNRAGRDMRDLAEEAEAKILHLHRKMEDRKDTGVVRIRLELPDVFAQTYIVPVLGAFRAAHPNVQFDIATTVRSARFATRMSDIALRLSRPSNGPYTMRRVGRLEMGLFCSEAYAADRGVPECRAALGDHALIGWREEKNFLPAAEWLRRLTGSAPAWLHTVNLMTQAEAVGAGLGIAVLPKFLAVKRGYRRVLEDESPLNFDLWLIRSRESDAPDIVDAASKLIERTVTTNQGALVFD